MIDMATSAQLKAIARIILYWNEAEHLIDSFTSKCLRTPEYLRDDLVVRIGGFEPKTDMIKLALLHDVGAKHVVYKFVERLLGTAKALKRHRDHIAHLAPSFELGIGTTKQRSKLRRMSLEITGVVTVSDHMDALVEELMLAEDFFLILYDDPGDAQARLEDAFGNIQKQLKDRPKLPTLPVLPK